MRAKIRAPAAKTSTSQLNALSPFPAGAGAVSFGLPTAPGCPVARHPHSRARQVGVGGELSPTHAVRAVARGLGVLLSPGPSCAEDGLPPGAAAAPLPAPPSAAR